MLNALTKTTKQAEYLERLIAAFGGNPEGWEWTGEMLEQDPKAMNAIPCACSHTGLRYLFPWENKVLNRKLITGSTCVEVVPGISAASLEGIKAKIAELKAAKAEAERKAKEASQSVEVAAIREALSAQINNKWGYLFQLEGYLSRSDYEMRETARNWRRAVNKASKLKTVRGQLTSLKKIQADFDKCYNRIQEVA